MCIVIIKDAFGYWSIYNLSWNFFAAAETVNIEEPSPFPNSSVQNQGADDVQDVDDFQDAMLHDMFEKASEVCTILLKK